MQQWIVNKGRWLQRRSSTILYLGLISWVWLSGMSQQLVSGWEGYARNFGWTVVALAPVLFFSWQQQIWSASWPARRYWTGWLLCFGLYVPGLLLGLTYRSTEHNTSQELLIVCCLGILLLELVLVVTRYGRQRLRGWKWLQRISFERALQISIALIAVTLAVMAVSSIGNPEYDLPDRLLLGFEFSIVQVFRHFDTFLSYTLQFLVMYGCGYFYFYCNSHVLVPKVLKQQGWVVYCLAGLALVALTYPVLAQLLAWLPINQRLGNVFNEDPFRLEHGYAAVLILLLSLPVILALQWGRQNNTILSLEKAKAQTELDLLQQQLNPHFFFNTLNNLYALSLAQAKETPDTILQLSDLMRYVIYKAKEPLVRTEEEIRYVEDYLQLQQMRLKRQPDIRFIHQVAPDAPPIPPLLLIVLVENACKHGIEPATGPSFLHLELIADKERLWFSCINSFEEQAQPAPGGIGLHNLQRRLDLLYPGKHRFTTQREKLIFKATLELLLV